MSSVPENGDAARAESQMSHDADDYLAPVSCSNTPTPIPLGAPPQNFYPIENGVTEEPLYHEIPGEAYFIFSEWKNWFKNGHENRKWWDERIDKSIN